MSYKERTQQAQRKSPATILTAMRSKDGKWIKLTVGEVDGNGYRPLARFVMDYGKVQAVMTGALDKLSVGELKDKPTN